MNLSNERRIAVLVFVSLLVLTVLSILSFTSYQKLISTSQLLTRTTSVISTAEQVLKSVVEVETGQRGFIITGDEMFLEPYYISLNRIDTRLQSLDSLTAGHQEQQDRVKILRQLVEKRISWSKQVIEVRRESFEEARTMVLEGLGNETTNEIRELITELQEVEQARFESRNSISTKNLKLFQFSFLALALTIMVVVSLLFYTINAALKARNKIELELQKSFDEIHDLYNLAPCGYHSLNGKGIFVNINQTELNWLGYSKEEVIGIKKFEDLLAEDSRETYRANFEKFKKGETITNVEFDLRRKNGSTFPVLVSAVAITDDKGEFIKSRTTVFDNTIRKQTEELIRENQERYRSIVTSVLDGIVIIDEFGKVISWNKGAEKTFGWTEEEMVGNTLVKIIPEKYRDLHVQGLTRYRSTKKSSVIGKTIELEGLKKDGTLFPIELSISTWQKGEHIFYCGILRDITERKHNEKLMSEMASIVESSQDAIISLSPDGLVTSWNKGAENLYGYKPDEVKGNSMKRIIPKELQENEARTFSTALQGIPVHQYETRRIRKDGETIDVALTISPIIDKSGNITGVSKIAHDITSRKNKENKIQQLNKELDAFTYSVSHDLRAPLRSISGFAQILLEDYSPLLDEEGKRVTNVIIKNAKRMGQLIDDLLDFARLSKKELSVSGVDMKQVVEQVLDELKEENKKIEVEMGTVLPAIADSTMITQVWINLISNAIKYSGNRESIKIQIDSAREDQETWYSVRDNGVGFDMNYYDKLFGVFQRLHKINEFEGTGVGLAIVKRIVQRHRGRVWAKGEVNKGATFYFSLPNTKTHSYNE